MQFNPLPCDILGASRFLMRTRMTARIALATMVVATLLAGCTGSPSDQAKAINTSGISFPVENTFMTINGERIDRELVLAYARARGFDVSNDQQVKQAADKLAEFVILAQAGQRDGANKADYAVTQLQSNASAYLSKLESSIQLSDEELQTAYAAQIATSGGVELNVQQILTADLSTAQLIQTQLAGGKAFGAIMTELKGNIAIQEIKDMGWTNALAFPEDLRKPLLEIKYGGHTANGVSLPNGYYFLNVSESRPLNAPPFAQVREGLKQAMTQSKLRELIDREKKSAQIEIRG
jgi:peptidyl-prolyl cis-trans isomerase C